MNINMKLKTCIIAILITIIVMGTSVVNATMYLPTGIQEMLSDAIALHVESSNALVNDVLTPIDESNKNIKPFIYTDEFYNEKTSNGIIIYIPLKFVAQQRGATVDANGNEYTITYNGRKTKLTIGSKNFITDGTHRTSSVVPVLKDNYVYVTLDIIYSALDLHSYSYSSNKAIILKDKAVILKDKEMNRYRGYEKFGFDFRDDIASYVEIMETRDRILNTIVNNTPRQIDNNNKDIKPVLKGEWNIVPLRFISESLGAIVQWNPKTYTAIINLNNIEIKITKGKGSMLVDGKEVALQTPAAIYGESMYVPLRAISEAFGKKVFYDRKVIIISDPGDKAYKSMSDKLTNNLDEYFKYMDLKSKESNTLVMYQDSPYAILNKDPIYIDNANKELKPILVGNYNVVPLRFISESLGATVDWDPNIFTAIIKLNNKTVRITKDKKAMTVDGIEVNLQAAARIYGESMYVPLRAISEAFGKKVFYDRKVIAISDTDIIDPISDKQVVDNLIEYFNNTATLEYGRIINIVSEKSMVDDLINYFENKRKEDIKIVNGNSPNNDENLGLVAKQGQWIYYSSYPGTLNPKDGLWKMKEDGSQKTKLDDGIITYINVVDDWVYYVKNITMGVGATIQKIKTDGTNNTLLVDTAFNNRNQYMNLHYTNEGLYYTNSLFGEINKVSLDGEADYNYVYYREVGVPRIVDKNTYYIGDRDMQRRGYIGRLNLDTGDKARITNDKSKSINIMGDYIYYENHSDKGKLYGIKNTQNMNTNELDKKKISNDRAVDINAYDGWIYYSNLDDLGKVYKIRPDGTGRVKLTNKAGDFLNIIGDWIYFWYGGMRRIKTNGTMEQIL